VEEVQNYNINLNDKNAEYENMSNMDIGNSEEDNPIYQKLETNQKSIKKHSDTKNSNSNKEFEKKEVNTLNVKKQKLRHNSAFTNNPVIKKDHHGGNVPSVSKLSMVSPKPKNDSPTNQTISFSKTKTGGLKQSVKKKAPKKIYRHSSSIIQQESDSASYDENKDIVHEIAIKPMSL